MPRLSAVEYDAEARRGQVAAIPAISGIREVTSGASPVQLVLGDRAPEVRRRDRLRLGPPRWPVSRASIGASSSVESRRPAARCRRQRLSMPPLTGHPLSGRTGPPFADRGWASTCRPEMAALLAPTRQAGLPHVCQSRELDDLVEARLVAGPRSARAPLGCLVRKPPIVVMKTAYVASSRALFRALTWSHADAAERAVVAIGARKRRYQDATVAAHPPTPE
jgi:hypothetical protein